MFDALGSTSPRREHHSFSVCALKTTVREKIDMLDPISALAFELHAGQGLFALLLGSGISRAAKIQTGWEITLDLVRRLAAAAGETIVGDPEAWYVTKFGVGPDYSELLDKLATTQAMRRQLVSSYIEPNETERAQGHKLPTAAHRAIARLMQQGYVRMVITTNFDRLLEQALIDCGVSPTVVATADQISGSMPIAHAGPMVVKLHGDYMDARIRNTAGELGRYDEATEQLLNRILDEFGLVVCGWSAQWDVALRDAIDRTPNRRFPTYWASRGAPAREAQDLIAARRAKIVFITDADTFFETLTSRVESIDRLEETHPLEAEIAISLLKEYLPEPRHLIRLNDLLMGEFNALSVRLNAIQPLPTNTEAGFVEAVKARTVAILPIIPLAYYSGIWATDDQLRPWHDLLKRLAERYDSDRMEGLPAMLLLYALGLGAVVGRKFSNVGAMLKTTVELSGRDMSLCEFLNPWDVVDNHGRFQWIDGYKSDPLAGPRWLADTLRPVARKELWDDDAFSAALMEFDLALALAVLDRIKNGTSPRVRPPIGLFVLSPHRARKKLEAWRVDHNGRQSKSQSVIIASLNHVPQFDGLIQAMDLLKREIPY